MKRIMLLSALICLFSVSIQAFAVKATIVDKKDIEVELTSVETKNIDFRFDWFELTIPVATISTIHLSEDRGKLILRTVTGKEVKGISNSELKGTWELGDYSITLSNIKSINFGDDSQLPQETTMADQPDNFVAICTDQTGATMEVFGFSYSFY